MHLHIFGAKSAKRSITMSPALVLRRTDIMEPAREFAQLHNTIQLCKASESILAGF